MVVRPADAPDLPACLAVRRRVFIEGQGVPEEIEIDGRDGEASHFLATVDGLPVGTARLRAYQGRAKVERVAVIAEHRRSGIGQALMEAVEAVARSRGFTLALLHAQIPVAEFYARLGYRPEGSTFLEADIPHVRMTKVL